MILRGVTDPRMFPPFWFRGVTIYRSRALDIISSSVGQAEKKANSLMSDHNISWYRVFLMSSSAAYWGTNNTLSLNLVVIFATVSVVCLISRNSLANCYTSTSGVNYAWNLVTKSSQVWPQWRGLLRHRRTPPTYLGLAPSNILQ